jgi:hypothetical protein
MFEKIPALSSLTIEQLTAAGAYYTAAFAFIIAVLTLIVTAIMLFLAVRQYSDVKRAEAKLRLSEYDQKKFENAQFLFRLLDKHEAGAFSELAAVESLGNYPEYYHVFKFILKRFETYEKNDINEMFIERLKRLIEKIPEKYRL